MSLVCHLFGHKRSSSRASFDDLDRYWVSECKRCFTILVRDGPGQWREAPPEAPVLAHGQPAILRSVRFTIIVGDPAALR